jgi:hypothetical protein
MCWKCSITDQHVYDLVVEGEEARRKRFTAELPGRLAKLGITVRPSKSRRYQLDREQARLFPRL